MDNSPPDQFFLQTNFMRMGLSFLADGEDPLEIEYGCGFLPFTCHPNHIAMRQRLKEVNDQWDAAHPEAVNKLQRVIRVRFNPKIELFLFPAEPGEEEETNSNAAEIERNNDTGNEEAMEGGDDLSIPASNIDTFPITETVIDDQIEENDSKEQGNEVMPYRSEAVEPEIIEVVLEDSKIEEKSTEIDVELSVEAPNGLVQPPIPNSMEPSISNLSNPKAIGEIGVEHCVSVIRAIFNSKTLAALLKLQQPKLLPLVRAQIHKKNVSPNLLDEIFSEKFLNLIFDEKTSDTPSSTDEPKPDKSIKKVPVPNNNNWFQSTDKGSRNSNGNLPEVEENQVKVSTKREGRGETPIKSREIVLTGMNMLGAESQTPVNTPLNIRKHVRGGGDLSSYPPLSHQLHRVRPKARPTSTTATVAPRLPISSNKPTSLNSAGKAKQRPVERVEDSKAPLKYPFCDSDWLERKIKENKGDPLTPSKNEAAVGSTPKKKVVYNWHGRHYLVDASPPQGVMANLSRQNSSTSINSDFGKGENMI